MLTLTELADAKRLPISFLTDQGLQDSPHGVEIPYFDCAGDYPIVKLRTALSAKEGSRWPKDIPLRAYGEWRINEARECGVLFLLEGESDSWTCWHHGYPALGIPGANAVDACLTAEHLEAVKYLYVHREPDGGGQQFLDSVTLKLARLGFMGYASQLRLFRCKDPSELHIRDPERFREEFERAVRMSMWIDLTYARHAFDLARTVARIEVRLFTLEGNRRRVSRP